MQQVALPCPSFCTNCPLSISHAEHNLFSSGFVKAGETVGIRASSLRTWFHPGLSDRISVYLVRPCTCSGVAATGGAEHFSALLCYRHGLFPGGVNASLLYFWNSQQFYYSCYPLNPCRFKQLCTFVLPLFFVCCLADDYFHPQWAFTSHLPRFWNRNMLPSCALPVFEDILV